MIPEEPQVTCGVCGQMSNLWDACHDENGDPLAPDHFMCPKCGYKYHRHHGQGRILSCGLYLPGEIEIRRTLEPWETTQIGRLINEKGATS